MGLFNKFPYTDLNSINLDYTLNKLNDLYERGETLYTQLQTWQAETTEDLASWKADVEAGLASWKTATEASIDNKIQLLTAAINAAFSDLETQLEAHISEIETTAVNAASAASASATAAAGSASDAADSATAAAGSASDAEDTAESLSESLDQIATNTSDITDLKSAITGDGTLNLDKSDARNAYPSSTIDSPVTFTNSSASISYNRIIPVDAGITYTITVTYNDSPASLNTRNCVVVNDSNIVKGAYGVPTVAGETVTVDITPTINGWLILCLDKYYTALTIKGYSVQAADAGIKKIAGISRLISIDSTIFTQGSLANNNGVEYDSTAYVRTGFIAVNPDTNIRITNNNTSYWYSVHQYDKDKAWISALTLVNTAASFSGKLASNCYYIRIVVLKNGFGNLTPADIANTSIFFKWDYLNANLSDVADAEDKIVATYRPAKFTGVLFSQGGLANGNGQEYSSTSYIRTAYLPVYDNVTLTVINQSNDTYRYSLHQYSANKSWLGALTLEDTSASKDFVFAEGCCYVRFVALKAGYGSITPTDINNAVINLIWANDQNASDDLNTINNARHIPAEHVAPLTLLHFSDLHKDTGALSRIAKMAKNYGTAVDDMICTGDMTANTYEQISSWWDADVMTCIGNHDTASYSAGSGYDWTALSMADRDAYYIAPFESNWDITHTSGTSYYYKDYASQKVRLIVMDAMLYTDNGAEATAQTSWLTDLLSDAITNSLHVLIAIHAPHGGATAVDSSFSRYNQGAMPTNADCNTPQAVIDAVAEAIGNGLNFVGYIVGHTHQDNIWDAENDKSQLMYCITCACVSQKAQWTNSDQHRSTTADAANLITIDTYNTLIKIVRCGGADIDDHMRTRKAICIDYSTGTIVGEVL